MKEIDWEERHFQICLALLARADIGLRGVTNNPRIPMIIRTADNMVEVLKKRVDEQKNAPQPIAEEKAATKKAVRSGGLWSQSIKCAELGLTNKQADLYQDVWDELEKADFKKGDVIPAASLVEACRGICELGEININAFEQWFHVKFDKVPKH